MMWGCVTNHHGASESQRSVLRCARCALQMSFGRTAPNRCPLFTKTARVLAFITKASAMIAPTFACSVARPAILRGSAYTQIKARAAKTAARGKSARAVGGIFAQIIFSTRFGAEYEQVDFMDKDGTIYQAFTIAPPAGTRFIDIRKL